MRHTHLLLAAVAASTSFGIGQAGAQAAPYWASDGCYYVPVNGYWNKQACRYQRGGTTIERDMRTGYEVAWVPELNQWLNASQLTAYLNNLNAQIAAAQAAEQRKTEDAVTAGMMTGVQLRGLSKMPDPARPR